MGSCISTNVIKKFLKIYKNHLTKYPQRVYNTIERRVNGLEKCPHCEKKKERTPEEYKKLINRLNRISGQINGIKKMVEESAYCPDILLQVAAANAALNSFSKELLAEHIRTCVADNIKNGNNEVIDELVVTLQKLMK
ncbi:MAG: metal-sensing transcriptional repressor [Oscillospiraceae bacterium]|nr:metal-sensing transcriptional repressor [Oscillospiraceae bacterium]